MIRALLVASTMGLWLASAALAGPDGAGAVDAAAAAEELASPWTAGLLMSMAALSLGAVSAVLGIWIGRDPERPAVFAVAMTGLIVAAVSVGGLQAYLDAEKSIQRQADLDRMLGMVDEIAAQSGDPKLADLVRTHRAKRR